jgi:hypothetical protein
MASSSEADKREEYITNTLKLSQQYFRQAHIAIYLHFFLQFIILLEATSLPFILNTPAIDKYIPTLISAVVAVATAISTFAKLGERASNLYLAGQSLRHERRSYEINSGPYKGLSTEEALSLFVQNIGDIEDKLLQSVISSSVYRNTPLEASKGEPSKP